MTEIDLITGILGSGKTTFIREYAKFLLSKGLKIAILENDFGAVNIDRMLLRDLEGEKCTIEMVSGCADPVCHKRRLRTQLIALGMQKFDRVIMEPSGIFDMDEFFDTLCESPLDRWFTAGNVITVVDGGLEDDMPPQMEFLLASQVSYCGKIYVSKAEECADKDALAESLCSHINTQLADISCSRRVSKDEMIFGGLTGDKLEVLSGCGRRSAEYVKKYSLSDISETTGYFMNITLSSDVLEGMLCDIFADEKCGRLYRIKGFVYDEDKGWFKVNSMSGKTDISQIDDGQSVLIAIGENIDKERISSYIAKYNTNGEYVCI